MLFFCSSHFSVKAISTFTANFDGELSSRNLSSASPGSIARGYIKRGVGSYPSVSTHQQHHHKQTLSPPDSSNYKNYQHPTTNYPPDHYQYGNHHPRSWYVPFTLHPPAKQHATYLPTRRDKPRHRRRPKLPSHPHRYRAFYSTYLQSSCHGNRLSSQQRRGSICRPARDR